MPTRRQLANALRVLSMDAIEQAKSGHPGAPLGMAELGETLFRHHLKHNPNNPHWVDRDRFVLSNGHASMLLYALLHLTGYDLSLDELRNFRQLGSKTPGHPEYGVTQGVDMTTGPLGQGIASAVGMALAERLLAQTFNRPDYKIVDHYTYCFCGDGCLMEGVAAEACSLAGTWKLGRLIVCYDANGISIDGKVSGWFTEDVAMRFRSMGWQVIEHVQGHDPHSLDLAFDEAKSDQEHPSLIIVPTRIGFASPKEDSAACHGAPLGPEACAATRKNLEWPYPPFEIPKDYREEWDARSQGKIAEEAWQKRFADYAAHYPDLAQEFTRRMAGSLPKDWETVASELLSALRKQSEPLATRKASQKCLEVLLPKMPELIGGSADLTGSVGTKTTHSTVVTAEEAGNYLYYGVREFGMSCIMNGLALHGGFLPYAGTFLSFSDQAKNALRLAALMQIQAIWVFTHDSIGVGEDGPTHQPVEQIPALRMIPGMEVWRPCDSLETAYAWKRAIERKGPTCLVLSRQSLPVYQRNAAQEADIARGGYILRDCEGSPELIILATGSEVELACGAWEKLSAEGRRVRVLSLPCAEVFDAQEAAWREALLPSRVRARLAIEAASPEYFYKYVGLDGKVLGMTSFGLSGKAKDVARHFGFTVEQVLQEARSLLS
ncbi:MAG: transketolase [Desulfovibrio sp.]|nr:transketolase [Desulfovibrio sp.]